MHTTGSPFRLDASDTPLRRLNTPSFCMKDVPKREQIALDLGEKYRNQKKRAIDKARRRRASVTPSPKRMNRLKMLNSVSPALKHFASLSRPNTPRDNTTGKYIMLMIKVNKDGRTTTPTVNTRKIRHKGKIINMHIQNRKKLKFSKKSSPLLLLAKIFFLPLML